MLRYLPLFTLGLWLAVPAAPVGAESDVASIAVPAGDLNLASAAGAAMLQRRVEAAARRVCADAGAGSAVPLVRIAQCRREAIARAAPEMHALLAAAHYGSVQLASR